MGSEKGLTGEGERAWARTGAIEIDPVRVELVAPQGSYVRLSSYCRHFEPRYQHFALAIDAKEALALGEAMSKGLVHARLVLEWRPYTSDETEEG